MKGKEYAVKREKKKMQPGVKLFLATLPFLGMYFLFSYLPLEGWKYAFFDYKPGYSLADCEFVEFKYFAMMFNNPVTRRETIRVLTNTFIYSGIGILGSVLPMFFAIFLNELPGKGMKKLIQTVTTVPHFVSWVIMYSLLFSLFSITGGVVNKILLSGGMQQINLLSDPNMFYGMLYGTSIWKEAGWGTIIYMAAIAGVDEEMHEAAYLDGANRFQDRKSVV